MEEKEAKQYEQPEWCTYPDASKPFWGCWSLLDGKVKNEDFCRTCECHKHFKIYENFFYKKISKEQKEMKEDLQKLFSDEELEEMANEAYTPVLVKEGTDMTDIRDDARYYYLKGLKDLRDLIFSKF